MKKLSLNKKTIARLDEPGKIFGGEKFTYCNGINLSCQGVCSERPDTIGCMDPETYFCVSYQGVSRQHKVHYFDRKVV